ncbi:small membrane A-kinase anchor protein isoform 4-T6 [Megaptera novaeangliae]
MRLNMRIKKFGTITNEEFRKSPRNSCFGFNMSTGKEVITDMMFSERLSKLHQTHRSCQKTVTRNLFKLYRNVSRVTYLSRIRRSGRARGK